MSNTVSGRCLCGAVTFEATYESLDVDVCHCGMCQRWTAGPYLTLHCSDVAMKTDAALGVYRSSDWGERCFCKECGTTLFWRMQDGSVQAVSVTTLDLDGEPRLASEIFVDEKPGWYAFANDTKKMTGAEVVAMFAGDQDQ